MKEEALCFEHPLLAFGVRRSALWRSDLLSVWLCFTVMSGLLAFLALRRSVVWLLGFVGCLFAFAFDLVNRGPIRKPGEDNTPQHGHPSSRLRQDERRAVEGTKTKKVDLTTGTQSPTASSQGEKGVERGGRPAMRSTSTSCRLSTF